MSTLFSVPPLPYAYTALEPYIDEATLHFHHDKHHQAYVDKLNEIITNNPQLGEKSLTELLTHLDSLTEPLKTNLTNQGGGVYNHNFLWYNMAPNTSKEPVGNLKSAIDTTFGSFEAFKTAFKDAAIKNFGSSWTWLVKNADNKLEICNTPNQVTPITLGLTPIMTIDLWEHAYYLKYQNRRPEYIDAFFNIINWDRAENIYNGKQSPEEL